MKSIKFLSLTGLMLMSTQQFAAVVESSQIMPPPGPYKSIMNNTPPAFVPYGSQQAQVNPHKQMQMPQTYSQFPAKNQDMFKSPIQQPEWVIAKQQENKDKITKMLKENESRYSEYLKKSEELNARAQENAKKRDAKNKQWIESNNQQMKKYWKESLNKFDKTQKKQIQQVKDMPDWMKERMLKQHEQQITMMNNFPPEINQQARANNMRNNWNNRPVPQQNRYMPVYPNQNAPMQTRPGFNQRPPMGAQPVINQQYRSAPGANRPQNTQQFVPSINRPFNHSVQQPARPMFNNQYAVPSAPVQPYRGQVYPRPFNQYSR